MRIRGAIIAMIAATLMSACRSESDTTAVIAPTPPPPTVLLKDIVIPNLPSPYYHFEYEPDGRIKTASFASGFTIYDVRYDGDRIRGLTNTTLGGRDTLDYAYDDAGRVKEIRYVNAAGVLFTALFLSYEGPQLTSIIRERKLDSDFVVDKTTTFSYYADGNVREITEYRPAIDGLRDETTTVDRFEEYDDGINVDAFSLLHTEFFDHLVLLPGVRLQTGNPRRVIHGGDGTSYQVDYTYAYDDGHRPLAKSGDLTFMTGADAGKHFQTLSVFSYY